MLRSPRTSIAGLGVGAALLTLGVIALISYASINRFADGAGWVILAGNALALGLLSFALVAFTREIAVGRKAERDLRQANAFLDSVFEHMPAMVFVKEAKGLSFVRHNKANQELLGYSEAQVLGKTDYDLFPKEQADFFTGKDRVVLSGRIVVDIPEEPVQTKLQGLRILHTRKIPVFDAEGQPQYLLGISEDITERKLAEQQIRDLNQKLEQRALQLEATNQELESFSYSVSHDLRAPLRAIAGYSRMLDEDYRAQLDAEAQRLLDVILDNARRMTQLIDDLLHFSKLGRQSMTWAKVDMTTLARKGSDALAEFPGPKLVLDTLPEAYGDPALLRQVWVNLLSNAAKYSHTQPAPMIEVTAGSDAVDHTYCVRDNGVGFDMKYYDKLFGVFQRLHHSAEFPGTGVGLAIVQRIIARHGGRVWAEGKVGEGATFFFSLPRRVQQESTRADGDPAA